MRCCAVFSLEHRAYRSELTYVVIHSAAAKISSRISLVVQDEFVAPVDGLYLAMAAQAHGMAATGRSLTADNVTLMRNSKNSFSHPTIQRVNMHLILNCQQQRLGDRNHAFSFPTFPGVRRHGTRRHTRVEFREDERDGLSAGYTEFTICSMPSYVQSPTSSSSHQYHTPICMRASIPGCRTGATRFSIDAATNC